MKRITHSKELQVGKTYYIMANIEHRFNQHKVIISINNYEEAKSFGRYENWFGAINTWNHKIITNFLSRKTCLIPFIYWGISDKYIGHPHEFKSFSHKEVTENGEIDVFAFELCLNANLCLTNKKPIEIYEK